MIWIIIIMLIILSAGGVSLIGANNLPLFNLDNYKQAIGYEESRNNYQAENKSSGALGYYQFIPSTLDWLQREFNLPEWIDKNNFLNNPKLQDTYFKAFVKSNAEQIMRLSLDGYLGQTIKGRLRFPEMTARVNWYGLQAGAHLGGVGGLSKFLKNVKDPDDGQTSVSDYVTYFSKKFMS